MTLSNVREVAEMAFCDRIHMSIEMIRAPSVNKRQYFRIFLVCTLREGSITAVCVSFASVRVRLVEQYESTRGER